MAKFTDNNECRINPYGKEEILNVLLDPVKTPIAYNKKVKDLLNSGYTLKDAERLAAEPIPMEIYFQEGYGIFLVESDAIESLDIFSPYDKIRFKSPDE